MAEKRMRNRETHTHNEIANVAAHQTSPNLSIWATGNCSSRECSTDKLAAGLLLSGKRSGLRSTANASTDDYS
jgi:hypothetical protein